MICRRDMPRLFNPRAKKFCSFLGAIGIGLPWAFGSMAQESSGAARDPSPPGSTPPAVVSREEYEALLRDQRALRAELEAMKLERERGRPRQPASRPSSSPASQPSGVASADQVDAPAGNGESTGTDRGNPDVEKQIREIRHDVSQFQQFRPGFDQLVIAGDAQFGFNALRHANSSFSAHISPLVLWRPADKLLVETAVDIGIGTDTSSQSSSTSFDLTIANASYEVNDYLLVGGGLFIVPFGQYHNHFDPPWINKLPDDPLAFSDGGIAPNNEVGFFARGAIPAGSMKFTYDLYVTNGPTLITNSGDSAGSLNFKDFTDLNGNKAFGGRIGIIPIPELEAGYSIQASEPNPSGFHRAHALLQELDFNYRPLISALRGVVDIRAEYVWSDVSDETFDPRGTLKFGPIRFGNQRSGGYVQLAYRPILLDDKILKRMELVGRYDFLNAPLKSPGGEHEHRLTLGVDYWLAPNAVFKIAYEFDDKKIGQRQDGFLAQFGIGF